MKRSIACWADSPLATIWHLLQNLLFSLSPHACRVASALFDWHVAELFVLDLKKKKVVKSTNPKAAYVVIQHPLQHLPQRTKLLSQQCIWLQALKSPIYWCTPCSSVLETTLMKNTECCLTSCVQTSRGSPQTCYNWHQARVSSVGLSGRHFNARIVFPRLPESSEAAARCY